MTQLALVIDLNVCVGCHACVTSCKEWNTSGTAGFLADENPYAKSERSPVPIIDSVFALQNGLMTSTGRWPV